MAQQPCPVIVLLTSHNLHQGWRRREGRYREHAQGMYTRDIILRGLTSGCAPGLCMGERQPLSFFQAREHTTFFHTAVIFFSSMKMATIDFCRVAIYCGIGD